MQVKDPKPGRYSPKCPKCQRKFALSVPQAAGEEPTVNALGVETPEVTLAPQPEADPDQTADALDPNATGAFLAPGETGTSPTRLGEGANVTQAARVAATDATGEFRANAAAGGAHEGMPTSLGGYQIVKPLGQGGMGAVYLARQVSLDRNVAVKTMKPQLAQDARFVARFTREAYAAAQLVHHNVVQIHDIGAERDINYFSMEFVKGLTLGELVKRNGPLDVTVAVGYMLQAARGLKFAHDQGMVHRDIKPDNLMLNEHGIVKVTDLGLVKTADSRETAEEFARGGAASAGSQATNITRVGAAMGTATYMAPEQARNAASVDARADIYSLGCTLYVLVTGRPPFAGQTALEVITKHASEPIVPPDLIVKRVPKSLSDIILRMVAKKPEDRYQNMGEVIRVLEGFLGVDGGAPFSPRQEHAQVLEEAVAEFSGAPVAKLRSRLILGIFVGSALLVLLLAVLGKFLLAGGLVGVVVLSAASYFVLTGIKQRTHLFLTTRALILGSSWSDWLIGAVSIVLCMTLLYVFGLHWIWLGVCVVSVGLALGLYTAFDRKLESARRPAVDKVERMLKEMRLSALDEDALRQFVCKYSGERWEELYEHLFGYEAKLQARERWGKGDRGLLRPKHGAWRDPLVRWLVARRQARQAARERKYLAKVEERGLKASGMDAAQARKQAEESAIATMQKAHPQIRIDTSRNRSLGLKSILSPKLRFLPGVILVSTCLMWLHQNHILHDVGNVASQTIEQAQQQGATDETARQVKQQVQQAASSIWERARNAKPLRLPIVPASLGSFLGSVKAGLAGLLLILSAFCTDWKKIAVCLVGAGLAIAFL